MVFILGILLQIEVAVFGSVHFKQVPTDFYLGDVDVIVEALVAFKPDLVCVEFLHPSIDPKEVWNYKKDRTADISWPISEPAFASLGKLYWEQGDEINAIYQIHLAENEGLDVSAFDSIRSFYQGNEGEVLGFETAAMLGHSFVGSFDWQATQDLWELGLKRIEKTVLESVDPQYRSQFLKALNQTDLFCSEDFPQTPTYESLFEWHCGKGKQASLEQDQVMFSHPKGALFGLQDPRYYELEKDCYYRYLTGIPGGDLLVKDYEFRNQRMCDFLIELCEERKAKRLLVIVGAGHKLFLEELLLQGGNKIISTESLLQGVTSN